MTVDWAGLIGYRDRDQLLESAGAKLRELGSKLTNWSKLSRLRTLAEALQQPVAELYVLLLRVVPQGWEQHAERGWLDLHSEAKSLVRTTKTPTVGWLRVTRTAGVLGNIPIPVHARFGTGLDGSGHRVVFRPMDVTVLPEGDESVEVRVQSEEAGAHTIVGVGTVVNLLTPIAGLGAVTNEVDWIESEGTDDESDADLRERNRLAWIALGFGANRAAYESWVRAVPGVVDVWIDDQHPRGQGSIDIVVMGTAGTPSESLLDDVRALVAERQALCANVLVRGPVEVPVTVAARVWLWPDKGLAAEVEARSSELLNALFTPNGPLNEARAAVGLGPVNRLRVAEDVRPYQCAALLAAPDVYDVEMLAPGANVPIGPGEVAVLGAPVSVEVLRRETP